VDKLLKVSEQTAWQLVGKVITAFSTLVVLSLISHHYNPASLGIYTLALTYIAFFYIAADLGLNGYILPSLSDQKEIANKLYSFRIYWALILIVVANLVAFMLPFRSHFFSLAVFYASFSILANAIFLSSNLIFQERLQYKFSVIALSLGSLLMIPVVGYLSDTNFPIYTLPFATTFSWVVTTLLALLLVKRFYKFNISKPDFSFFKKTFKEAWPLSSALVLNVVYFRMDSFILSSVKGFADVGIYNFAYQFFQTALVVPTFIMNGYYPLMLNSLKTNYKQFLSHIKIAALILFLISLGGVILTFLLSPFIINLVGDGKFSQSVLPLNLLALSFPAFFVSSLGMWIFVSLKKYKTMVLIYLIGLIFNLILNFIFIPKYSYIAASLVTGLSEYLILVLQIIILAREFKNKWN
jgi:O-antigen/teichoic acid export membrane protein